MAEQRRQEIQKRITELKSELHDLEEELRRVESEANSSSKHLPMHLDEYRRYGRQMILPGFGLQGAFDADPHFLLTQKISSYACE